MRPVDLQITIPQSGEVSRINNATQSRPEVANQMFANQLQKEIRHDSQHVLQSNKGENASITKDGSNKNNADKKKKRKRERRDMDKSTAEAAKAIADYKGSIIDISV